MKNNSLFLLVAALFAIVSCGATDLYAQKRVSQYKNGIYYSSQQPVQNQPAQIYSEEVPAIDTPPVKNWVAVLIRPFGYPPVLFSWNFLAC